MAKHDDAAAGTVNIDRALKAYALAPLAALLLPFYWLYEGRASHTAPLSTCRCATSSLKKQEKDFLISAARFP
jgi:hypothetical protein